MEKYLLCLLGACIQEVLHWVDLKQVLGGDVRLTRSVDYWVITLAAIVVFSLATPVLVDSFDGKEQWHYIVVAFMFPSVIRKLAKISIEWIKPGPPAKSLTHQFKTKNYFKIF